MKVEMLYFDGCPHYLARGGIVAETLRTQGVNAEVERAL